MPRRPTSHPRRDIKPKYVLAGDTDWQGAELAARVRYEGSGKHKTYPPPPQMRGAWIPTFIDDGQTERCGHFAFDEWADVQELLRRAVAGGFVAARKNGQPDLRDDGMPSRAWAFVDDVLHEARYTNNGVYHAFPLSVRDTWPQDPYHRLEEAPRWERRGFRLAEEHR